VHLIEFGNHKQYAKQKPIFVLAFYTKINHKQYAKINTTYHHASFEEVASIRFHPKDETQKFTPLQ